METSRFHSHRSSCRQLALLVGGGKRPYPNTNVVELGLGLNVLKGAIYSENEQNPE